MADREESPSEESPLSEGEAYGWDKSLPLPQEAVRKWHEVAQGIDKSQTVVWKNAVHSLDWTNRYLITHEEARQFMERYMKPVISILVEQQPAKIGQHERSCVEESLELATHIVAKDIRIQLKRKGESVVLDVLQLIFNKKKAYYREPIGNWNSHLRGLPEVRLRLIERFRTEHGFSSIAEYLSKRVNTPQFPSIEILHQILAALCDIVPNSSSPLTERKDGSKEVEDDAILVAQAAIDFIASCSDDRLKKQPYEILSCTREDLRKLFDRLVITRRKETYAFYDFWRALTLKLITSQSLPLKLFGWDEVSELIVASAWYRPPAKSFIASGAGCSFVDGVFSFVGTIAEDGYAVPGDEVSYVRRIPETEKVGGGKCLTLFLCTMRSQQKWWFISEADEEQPGTDRDIDYYQYKSKEREEREPPPDQWITCRNAGVDPPPKLRGEGLMVPPGEEYNTLDHQLAKWAIENGIVELVLHREIVARSAPLIKFLASIHERDVVLRALEGAMKPNTYRLMLSKHVNSPQFRTIEILHQRLAALTSDCMSVPIDSVPEATISTFKDLLFSEDRSDVKFVCEDGEAFPAHKAALAACSPYFAAAFQGPWAENSPGREWNMAHPSPIIKAILTFAYTGYFDAVIFREKPVDMFAIAAEFDIAPVKEFAMAHCIAAVSAENFREMLQLAYLYDIADLNSACHEYLAENPATIDIANFKEILQLAACHGIAYLKTACCEFAKKNLATVLTNPHVLTLANEDAALWAEFTTALSLLVGTELS